MTAHVATLESKDGILYRGRYKVANIANLLVHVEKEIRDVQGPTQSYACYEGVWEWRGEMCLVYPNDVDGIDLQHRIRFDAEYKGKMHTFSGKVYITDCLKNNDDTKKKILFVGNDELKGFLEAISNENTC